MTRNEKELLLKDICARLPYGMKAQVCERNDEDGSYFYNNCKILGFRDNGLVEFIRIDDLGKEYGRSDWFNISWFKPYLFPLSSMTEEQKIEMNSFDPFQTEETKTLGQWAVCLVEFYNKYHLDYRGLIEKGLAIDATGLNIY